MTSQKFFWAENIRFLRNRKKISQEALAEMLGISRSKLNAHENGKTINPPIEDLVTVSNFFKISIDSLLKVNLSKLGELKLRTLEAGNDVYLTGGNIRVLAISVDKENKENIEYVPIKAKAGYASGYSDPEFIAQLPKYSIPNLKNSGTYRIFPISGDSMLPIPSGAEIVAQYVQDWKSLKAGTPCIVILKGEQDFIFKLVSLLDDGTLQLVSLNKSYKPYTVTLDNVLELWAFDRYISKQLPDAPTELDEIKQLIVALSPKNK